MELMTKQEAMKELKEYGECSPTEESYIYTMETIGNYEKKQLEIKNISLESDKYYIFIEGGKIVVVDNIKEAVDVSFNFDNKRIDYEYIKQGDLVNFGQFGEFYVCNIDYSESYFWVTKNKDDRNNEHAIGWTMRKNNAISIIEDFKEEF